jgi:hypothetical protein
METRAMMLYDIFSRQNRGFDRETTLRAPLDATEYARNVNWDKHTLYADALPDGSLVWRRPDELSAEAQRQHGVGPTVERRRQAERRQHLDSLCAPWTLDVPPAKPVEVQVTPVEGRTGAVWVSIDGKRRDYAIGALSPVSDEVHVVEAWRRIRERAEEILRAKDEG